MKKFIILIAILVLFVSFSLPKEQHEAIVTDVKVPVRVFDGSKFIDNLTIEDFELYEDGKPQKIEAVYLINKTNIERQLGEKDFNPTLSRTFYFLFQLTEYNPKLGDAIDYFFNQAFLPGDMIVVQTPVKNYSIPKQALQTIPKETLAKDLKSIVKKDTKVGNMYYNNLLKELKNIVRSISGSTMGGMETDSTSSMFSLEFLLPRYRETLQKMEDLRIVEEKRFINFAKILKNQKGQKSVFFIYQREFRPEISQSLLNQMMSTLQDQPNIMSNLQDLFQFYHRNISINPDKIKAAFADALINFNLIFMNKDPENVIGVIMREQSEDVFKVFSEVAKTTGGVADISQNPYIGFKNAVETAESYYLLYYSPADYLKDGKFKKIEVRLKNNKYKITHRLGYFAN